MEKIIMHIDVNNAFLSWTAVKLLHDGYKIDIREIEAVIAGDENKRQGIVLAKSPIAKEKGVCTAETLRNARIKCNNLKVFNPDFRWYNFLSNKMFELIRKYTDDIEILSIDECFLDYTYIKSLYGDPIKFAYKLKDEIYKNFGFTVNIGIANNKLCAKMASDFKKPNRVHTLFLDEVQSKMYPLDVGDLFGIGKQTTKKLKELNINTIGDLAHKNASELYKYFKNQANIMIEHAKGIDNTIVKKYRDEIKCISNSATFSYNLTNIEDIYIKLHALAENVCRNLRRQKKYCKVIGVGIRNKYFQDTSHQIKLKNATCNTEEVYNLSKKLFKELWDDEPIRLLRISLGHLVGTNNHQISFFEDIKKKESDIKLDKIMDELKIQYGSNIISNATLANDKLRKKY